jgi:hypothetical protein
MGMYPEISEDGSHGVIEPWHYSEWFGSLSHAQLIKLREMVRKVHMREGYRADQIDNRTMDRIIEAIGPRVADVQMKAAIDAGIIDN